MALVLGVIALILFALCLIFGHSTAFAFWEDDLTYEGESIYNYLQVREDENSVKAELRDGVLTITFEKEKVEAPKVIPVQ